MSRFRALALVLAAPIAAASGQKPCDKAMQVGMLPYLACIDSSYAAADSELNAIYAAARAQAGSQESRLVAAQRAWVALKVADDSLLTAMADGNHPSEFVLPQLTTLTLARIAFLREQFRLDRVTTPRPPASPEEARLLASMKMDLRNLVVAEEAYFSGTLSYTSEIGPKGVRFAPSGTNNWPRITATKTGWTAVIGNPGTPRTCTIWIGSVSPHPPSAEGLPICL